MSPYLVIVVLNPTEREKKHGKTPTIVVQPTAVMARDKEHLAIRAMRLVPEEHADADERLEVRSIPFAG